MVQQEAVVAASKQQQDETYVSFHDFLKLYEGQRAEWLMGRVEVYVTNNVKHQAVLLFLSNLLNYFVSLKNLGQVLLAGVSMYVGDDIPAREPDLIVVLNEHLERIKPTYLDGVGDVVFEVVSPESVARDYGAKFQEYEQAGVPEYWLIDPMREATYLYVLGEDKLYHLVKPNEAGELASLVMPGFTLNPQVLWQDVLPNGVQIVEMAQKMAQG